MKATEPFTIEEIVFCSIVLWKNSKLQNERRAPLQYQSNPPLFTARLRNSQPLIAFQNPPRPHLARFCHAVPNVNSPYAASTLSPIGSGLPVLIARGIELPARTSDASSASSTP